VYCFALTAAGDIKRGMDSLEGTANFLATRGQYSIDYHAHLVNDLQMTVNSELIKMGLEYRCQGPLSAIRAGEGEGSHTFWEWLDLPEE
jgi:hypothetical protein